MKANEQWQELINRYLDGMATAEEVDQIEELLRQESSFADQFAETACLHRQIFERIHEDKLHDILSNAVSGTMPNTALTKAKLSDTKKAFERRIPYHWFLAALIASILVTSLLWNNTRHPEDTFALRMKNREAMSHAATIAVADECIWSDSDDERYVGQRLRNGDSVAIESGLLKLIFESGAEVTLEGPCDLEIENSMLGYLRKGNLKASVPPRAFSFAIQAPGLDIIDLGTEFGVSIKDNGQTELHVFDGEVVYRQDNENSKSNLVHHVAGDNAVNFQSSTKEPNKIDINLELFSSHGDLHNEFSGDHSLPVNDKLVFWLAADQGIQTSPEDNVIAWHDLIIGDNKSAEDAFPESPNLAPTLVSDAINGHPAVRFDGYEEYLVTTPIATTDSQTVVILCQFGESAFEKDREFGGQIINYDGPPTRELTNRLAPGVLQIGEPLLASEFKPSLVTAQVFAGFIGTTTVEAGRVDAASIGPNIPIVIAYRYDYDKKISELFINGVNQGTANAFAPAAITSRKVIGRHAWMKRFFGGDLAELQIYNKALTDDQLSVIHTYLKNKYDL